MLGSGGCGAGQDEGGDDDRALLRLLLQGTWDLGGDAKVHWEAFFKWHQRWGWGACLRTALRGGSNHRLHIGQVTYPVC